jgi:transposase
MFVPCDDDGNVLEEPQKENFTEENGFVNNAFFIETNVFQTAQSKVIFSQFRVIENDSKSHPKTVQFQNLVNAFWFLTETNSWHISKGLKKVEDLIPYNPDLAISF